MIPVEKALESVLAHTPCLPVEEVPLEEAVGRVLAEDVASDVDMPPFDRSAMDGYAVRAADVAHDARRPGGGGPDPCGPVADHPWPRARPSR